jgi:transcriptional regulator CtsR
MEKKFISCDMLSYRVWNELVVLLAQNGIVIYKMEGGKKYIYVEYLVNKEEYELVNKLTRKVQNMLDIQAYKSIIISVVRKR